MYTRQYDDSRGTIDPPENYSGYVFDRSAKGGRQTGDAARETSIGGAAESERSAPNQGARGEADVNRTELNSQTDEQKPDAAVGLFDNNRTNADAGCPFEHNHANTDAGCPFEQNRANTDAGCPFEQNRANSDVGCPFGQNRANADSGCKIEQNHSREDMSAERQANHQDGGSGLLSGLLNRFKHLEFDDLLLLGLIILLWNGRNEDGHDGNDDLLLILGLLFITGI